MPVEKTKKKTKTPYVATEKAFDISPSADGGVLKEIIKEGCGEYLPTSGCKVSVHYEGTLTDGTIFDSSRQRSPFEFNLGKGSVIKAWDIGVATMKRGEIAVLTCKSEYAYGAAGSPPTIPPDATLIFEIEVLDWQAEDLSQKKDGGILRQVIEPGEGHATPNEGSVVDIQIVGECLGRVFDERTVSFTLGEGQDLNIPPGVERALEKFKLKERSRLELKAAHGWGHTGNTVLAVPSDTDLIYTVTLNNFERMKEAWALDAEDKLKQAKFHKEKGTDYFKAQKYELAIKMYKRAIQFVEFNEGFEAEAEDERKPLVLVLHLNTAACYLKLEQYVAARDSASLALGVLPTSEKGLFRRGQALLELGEPEKARADFEQLLRLDPANKAAAHQLTVCARRLQEQLVKEKKIYANMFEKFARRDREKEEEERQKQPDVMKTLGEWGQDEREREPTDFEKENPNILMLDGNGDFKNM